MGVLFQIPLSLFIQYISYKIGKPRETNKFQKGGPVSLKLSAKQSPSDIMPG